MNKTRIRACTICELYRTYVQKIKRQLDEKNKTCDDKASPKQRRNYLTPPRPP